MSVYGVKPNKCLEQVPSNNDLGTASNFGLCKTINDFNEPSGDQSGRALAASAGYVLAQTLNTVQQQGTTNTERIGALETTVTAHTGQLNALNTKTQDTGWLTLPLASGISAAATGAGTPRYRRIGTHVYIRGSVTFTVPASGSTTLATLPADVYYPSAAKYDLMACDNNRMAQNHINTSGQVICDYIVNVNDGSRFSGVIEWADITMDFFTD